MRTSLVFYGACFVFLYLNLFYLPAVPIFNEADHLNLLNDAKRITEGEVIYRDFFEFVFPGAPALYALLMTVFGPKYWLLNAVILIHGMLAAYLGEKISRQVISDSVIAYLPSAIFLFFGFRWLGGDGEHRMISPLFAYLAVLLLIRERTSARLILAGIACAFASFFSQQRGVLVAAAIVIFLFAEFGLVKRDWRRFLRNSFLLGTAFVGGLAVLTLPFVVMAGADSFFDSTFAFLLKYVQDPDTNSLRTYLTTLTKIRSQGTMIFIVSLFYSALIPGIYFIVFAVAAFQRRRSMAAVPGGMLLLCVVGLLLSLGSSGPNVARLFQVALPALVALVWLVSKTRFLNDRVSRIAIASLAVIGIALGIRLQTAPDSRTVDTPSGKLVFLSAAVRERYEWLSENAAEDDLVYETYNSHVNFPLGLRNPSRLSILLNSGYSPPEHVRWAIDDLKRTNPRYIIWDGTWTREIAEDPERQRLEPFYRFLTSNYRRVKSFTPYDGREREVWERADLVGQEDR